MSTPDTLGIDSTPAPPPGLDTALLRRQIGGILRLEIRRNLFRRSAFALYFLAFAPVMVAFLWAISPFKHDDLRGPAPEAIFAGIFESYVRVPIFLSALFVFMSLFRSEILEKSLHYYFLTPVRREVLVVGKYLSALISVCLTFAVSTAALFVLFRLHWGFAETGAFLFRGPGLGQLFAYVGIAMLACAGYGAIFLLVGLFFRNPVVPAALIWGWEFASFLMPPMLKKIGVIHYLQSLYPIPFSDGHLLEILAEPTPAWISIPGILLFTLAVLTAAGWRARHMEIDYGGD